MDDSNWNKDEQTEPRVQQSAAAAEQAGGAQAQNSSAGREKSDMPATEDRIGTPYAAQANMGAQQPWAGYYPYYWPYYYMPSQAQQVPQPSPAKPLAAGKKAKAPLIIAFVAMIVLSVFLGAFLSVYVVYPWLKSHDGTAFPDETPSEEVTDYSTTPKEDEYSPNEKITSIGGAAPIITDAASPVPEIAAALSKSVVGVNAKVLYNGELITYSRGTGFVIQEDGYIITNYHVVAAGKTYTVTTQDGAEYDALYVGGDVSLDIVVLKVDIPGLKALALGDSSVTRVGELAIAMGNPSGAGENLVGSVTVGYVSAINRELVFNGTTQTFIQTDAALNPGNSGGPLVNNKGEVVGVVTLKSLVSSVDSSGAAINAEGIGFAIPIDIAAGTALDIINNGSVKRPGIGIQYRSLTTAEAAEANIPVGKKIYSFMNGSPAQAAGLKVDDIIIKCNGEEIGEGTLLVDIISNSTVGDHIVLTVWRGGQEIDYTVVIGNLNEMLLEQ